jgi:RimJ/RimL family protein N-acetyltransferase
VTERLVLRAWEERDLRSYARIVGDPDVMCYLGSGLLFRVRNRLTAVLPFVAEVEARRRIGGLRGHWKRWGFGEWAVEEAATGTLVGQIGLVAQPDWTADPANVEVGWTLARSAWGQGYATEGGRAALGFAFEELGLERIVSIARVENERSQRVMQRLGMWHGGAARWRGSNVVWYAIDRSTWERRSAADP